MGFLRALMYMLKYLLYLVGNQEVNAFAKRGPVRTYLGTTRNLGTYLPIRTHRADTSLQFSRLETDQGRCHIPVSPQRLQCHENPTALAMAVF